MMLTGEQIRAARALARMDQATLATNSGLSLPTVKRLEGQVGPISANTSTEAALRAAFEAAGVILIDENGQGPGVRLRKSSV
ncbi:MAG: XRE family transcriptional regulator [Phenylobacterium sp. RIFCSPHIGHO2_01_FULL_69_31]|nr:MAG: XRE family transcriptional regulator [Phenylobacterium sp. RIFCSPHIGHO2_01_FULL_69_31]